MRLISELKRRKVFQTAAIYAASAWLLLQVAEFLLQMLEIPAWGLKLVFVVLLVGFPLALVLSWMNQITAHGIRRESDAGASDIEPEGSRAELPAPAGPVATSPGPADCSIAVLPFANMSDDPANVHFADGLWPLRVFSREPKRRRSLLGGEPDRGVLTEAWIGRTGCVEARRNRPRLKLGRFTKLA